MKKLQKSEYKIKQTFITYSWWKYSRGMQVIVVVFENEHVSEMK